MVEDGHRGSGSPTDAGRAPHAGFDVARRGYDRAQVDEYFALPAQRRPDRPQFDLVRRGYDRRQVDEAITLARAAGPHPPTP
ncbi:hypothetical protein [Kitasatospora sp. NPDC096140]|uniref:hypothetical protein n=1 Tax=Kitasatospora sp. NPDC096140 TaxID=3155425 RepID=UPI00331D8256